MNRGILATCYARPTQAVTTESLREVLHAAYDAEPFVVVRHEPPPPDIKMAGPGHGSSFRGKGPSDVGVDGLRMIAFGYVEDGSRVMYDSPVEVAPETLAKLSGGRQDD